MTSWFRRMRLTPERKWLIFLRSTRKGQDLADLCKRYGITPRQLRKIQSWARPSPVKDRVLSGLRVLRDGAGTSAFFTGLMVFFFSVAGFYAFLPVQAANNWPTWGVAAVLPLFIAALGFGIFWLFEERRRKRLFLALVRDGLLGWVSPILVAGFIFLLAVNVFAAAAFVLEQWGVLDLSRRSCASCAVGLEDLSSFYTWHFLQAVPLLDVNESLQWEVPVTYSGALTGWLVLAFKAAVIIPLIQAIRTYAQVRREIPRIRIRPWAWPRVARVGDAVKLNWSPTQPPPAYVFDVKVSRSRKDANLERRWLKGTTTTSGAYTPRTPGKYFFHVEWRERMPDDVLMQLEAAGVSRPVRSRKVAVSVRPSTKESHVEPIHHMVTVRCPPERAFKLFTEQMGTWWPIESYSRAVSEFQHEDVEAVKLEFQPRLGGSILEHMSDGRILPWAEVIAWDPPWRVRMA